MLFEVLGDDPRPDVERSPCVESHPNIDLLVLIKRRLRRNVRNPRQTNQNSPNDVSQDAHSMKRVSLIRTVATIAALDDSANIQTIRGYRLVKTLRPAASIGVGSKKLLTNSDLVGAAIEAGTGRSR
jgi:hypothetical protein